MTTRPSSFTVRRPAVGLARFVSHYWLSLNNPAPRYTALPDGCVDLVLEVTATDYRSWVYGTTTAPAHIACNAGSHYLGVRFQPGQSRHFIRAAADEITDSRADLLSLMEFPLDRTATRIVVGSDALFEELDAILRGLLRRASPAASYIDHVIEHVDVRHGRVRVADVAAHFGKSRRQMERAFVQSVGVPLKFFSRLSRLRHAAQLIVSPHQLSLSAVAHDAGFSDQAHMTRDFTQLAGISPGQLRRDDAFFQYHSPR